MARGWESKDVENRREQFAEERLLRQQAVPSAEQVEADRRLADLQLNRSRVQRDIELASNPRYRDMLEESLAFLNAEIAKLTGSTE